MDLNAKLAARRRELAIEAEKVTQVEAARLKEAAIEAAKVKRVEQDAIDAEVARRLAERGIVQPAPVALATPPVITASVIDAEVEKAIDKAAAARMTGAENTMVVVLFLTGLVGFFFKWWIGLGFIIWSVMYSGVNKARYKQEIIAEGKAKVAKERTGGQQYDQFTSVAVVLISTGGNKVEVIKVIRALTGLGLKESKDLVDLPPCLVMQGMSATDAEILKGQLENAGATVEIKY